MVVCLYVEQMPSTHCVPTTLLVSIYFQPMILCMSACWFIILVLLQRDTLEMVGEPVSGMARCPYDPRHANVALFSGRTQSLHLKIADTRLSFQLQALKRLRPCVYLYE